MVGHGVVFQLTSKAVFKLEPCSCRCDGIAGRGLGFQPCSRRAACSTTTGTARQTTACRETFRLAVSLHGRAGPVIITAGTIRDYLLQGEDSVLSLPNGELGYNGLAMIAAPLLFVDLAAEGGDRFCFRRVTVDVHRARMADASPLADERPLPEEGRGEEQPVEPVLVLFRDALLEAYRVHATTLPFRSRSFWPSGLSSPFGPTCR